MNKSTRKELSSISDRLDNVQSEIRSVIEDLEYIRDEEQDKYDNLPENFQTDERQEQIDELDGIIGDIDGVEFDDHIERLRNL